MDDLEIALKNVTKITPNQFCQWEISFFSGESHAGSSTWESLFTAVDKNIKKNWVKYYVHFFLLAGKQVEYSCYVDLKSFLSVKSSAENSLEFRRKSGQVIPQEKRPKGLVKSCWRTFSAAVLSSRLSSYIIMKDMGYSHMLSSSQKNSLTGLLLSLLQKQSFSKACYLWKEPFRRKLYISTWVPELRLVEVGLG